MDREHPIPQEVSTYEFRLVGDMTIKQFMRVAAGALIALVLYSSGIPPYVKWPLIVISFVSGVALAFFPIEDRPLSKWIVLFAKAIYSPTVYVWNKDARKYESFQPENVNITLPPLPTTPPADQSTNSAQASVPNPTVPAEDTKLNKEEEVLLNKVDRQFANSTPITTPVQNINNIQPLTASTARENIRIPVPETKNVSVGVQEKTQVPLSPPPKAGNQIGGEITPMTGSDTAKAKSAIFSEDASPPSPPTRPNVIVGQILDPEGKIVDGAILEIKDTEGRSVRALRSNRLGHFMIVTPLGNGQYKVTVEKEGLNFEPVSFEAKDQIIPPIAIWAKA